MGKDNITFHSQIWPSEMLAYNGKGSKGGETGELGPLNLPEQVVALRKSGDDGGKKFSSSRGIVIYVKDILARYPVDAVRYYISIAGPETSDADSRGPSSYATTTRSWPRAGAIWSIASPT